MQANSRDEPAGRNGPTTDMGPLTSLDLPRPLAAAVMLSARQSATLQVTTSKRRLIDHLHLNTNIFQLQLLLSTDFPLFHSLAHSDTHFQP